MLPCSPLVLVYSLHIIFNLNLIHIYIIIYLTIILQARVVHELISHYDKSEWNNCFIIYIPLISRVRGPYGKLWTEFFPFFYGPSAKRAGHENKEGKKRGSITCHTDRANEANKMFIIWLC